MTVQIVAAAQTAEAACHNSGASCSPTMLPPTAAGAVETPLPVIAVAADSRCARPYPCDATPQRNNSAFTFLLTPGGYHMVLVLT